MPDNDPKKGNTPRVDRRSDGGKLTGVPRGDEGKDNDEGKDKRDDTTRRVPRFG